MGAPCARHVVAGTRISTVSPMAEVRASARAGEAAQVRCLLWSSGGLAGGRGEAGKGVNCGVI